MDSTSSAFDAARQQRARSLREVLDDAPLEGSKPQPHALAAASDLLEMGFPYAFELTPGELAALRLSQRVEGLALPAVAMLGVVWIVGWAWINVALSVSAFDSSGSILWRLATFPLASPSAAIGFGAGYDLFRLFYAGSDQWAVVARLKRWSRIALALMVIDAVIAFLASDGSLGGLANPGWIIPFTLPIANLTLRRLRRVERHRGPDVGCAQVATRAGPDRAVAHREPAVRRGEVGGVRQLSR